MAGFGHFWFDTWWPVLRKQMLQLLSNIQIILFIRYIRRRTKKAHIRFLRWVWCSQFSFLDSSKVSVVVEVFSWNLFLFLDDQIQNVVFFCTALHLMVQSHVKSTHPNRRFWGSRHPRATVKATHGAPDGVQEQQHRQFGCSNFAAALLMVFMWFFSPVSLNLTACLEFNLP